MKKKKFMSRTFVLLLATAALFSCKKDDDRDLPDGEKIEAAALPEASRNTLSTYFNDATVASAKRSSSANIYGSIYTALLSNSFEIDFDENGLWTEIESEKNLAIPARFLADQLPEIQAYLAENYAVDYVIEIERERFGFTVGLNNGVELVFDREQRFIGVDLDDDDKDEIRIPLELLPANARNFLSTSFNAATAISVKKDTDDNKLLYKVYLDNGIKVKFDASGNWIEIESKRNLAIPEGILPVSITQYILQTYPAYTFTEVEKNSNGGFAVEIEHRTNGNDLELIFDANGNFIRID